MSILKPSACSLCSKPTPKEKLSSCLGYRFQDSDLTKRLGVTVTPYQLGAICSFEGAEWFCEACVNDQGFCLGCQKETTKEDRDKVKDG